MSSILSIAENERRYVAQELHDYVAQTLLQMNMQVNICQQHLKHGDTDALQAELALLEQQSTSVSRQVRQLMDDLLPPPIENGAFKTWLSEHIHTHRQRGGAPVSLSFTGEIALDAQQQLAVARIIQEALQNIRKHAQASTVTLSIESAADRFQLTISDDGIGFDTSINALPTGKKAGIENMYFRAEAIGAELTIKSQPKHGTLIQLTVPLS